MPTLPKFRSVFRSQLLSAHALRAVRRLAEWRNHLLFYWRTLEKGSIVFLSALILPTIALGFMLRFAYVEQTRMEVERHRRADLTCLAKNVYFEARGEPVAGQLAVAEVTMNRVASSRFPATVCEVVHEKRWDTARKRYVGAFSWTELGRMGLPKGKEWRRAMEAARAVYDNEETARVDEALYFHATHAEPSWRKTKTRVAKIGRHIFYR